MFFTSELCRIVTRFDECNLLNASFDTFSSRGRQAFASEKEKNFRLHKIVLDTGIYIYHVYCSHDESKYPLMLNNLNPKIIFSV